MAVPFKGGGSKVCAFNEKRTFKKLYFPTAKFRQPLKLEGFSVDKPGLLYVYPLSINSA